MTNFPFLAPEAYLKKINHANVDDPLLKQIKIDRQENQKQKNYVNDPLGEYHYEPVPGLLHKYQDRALILVSNCCSIHCRFCFRRNLDYPLPHLTKVLSYLTNHPEITEVILSGGDPLSLPVADLNRWLTSLNELPSLKRIRIHSRKVIVDPTFEVNWYHPQQKQLILVTHCNHPQELSKENEPIIQTLKKNGYFLLNQGVLLKGINDQVTILSTLFQKLFDFGILPYYFHLLDKVAGAQHFAVSKTKAKQLYRVLRNQIPGYLLPKFVVETAVGKELI